MRRVLVVDDDLNLLRVLRMRLEADGYAVLTAPDAQTALRLAEEGEAFDLALVDLKLAEANGIDLMEGLRRRRPRLPVIILTAYGTIETAVEAMKKGAWSYLTKPFDHAQLLAEIEGALAGRGGERGQPRHLRQTQGRGFRLCERGTRRRGGVEVRSVLLSRFGS